jgi:hypothetical protein
MPAGPRRIRWFRVIGIAMAATVAIFGLLVLQAAPPKLPDVVANYPLEWAWVIVVLALAGFHARLQSRRRHHRAGERVQRLLDLTDRGSERALDGGFALALALFAGGLVLSWVPHYLTWPWCRDEDTFAALAMSWDAGIKPYRDIRSYNFPGHIYLHWLIGRAFGWGHTAVFYALDAAAVVAFGAALWAWSRRRFAGALPGMAGYIAFLGFYLGQDFGIVAERDWHATLAAALAVMALEAWPRTEALWMAGALEAAALTIRPHAILFVPAMISAIVRRPRPARAIALWASALVLFTALGFLTLVAHGILDDFVRGLHVAAYGGPYSRVTPQAVIELLGDELLKPWMLAVSTSLLVLSVAPSPLRGSAQTWLLALTGALLYRVLHPVPHFYLALAPAVMSAVGLALPTAWLVSRERLSRHVRVLAIVLVLLETMPRVPLYCSPIESVKALGPLARGEDPIQAPLGCRHTWFGPLLSHYRWNHCRAAMNYLRRTTSPDTEIANVLREPPFPAMNGPVGRRSPFRAESGICWMYLVDIDLDSEFARELEATPNSVVVWSPDELGAPRLELPHLRACIRRLYRPEARFGPIEVWRRAPAGEIERTPTPGSPTSSGSRPEAISREARR